MIGALRRHSIDLDGTVADRWAARECTSNVGPSNVGDAAIEAAGDIRTAQSSPATTPGTVTGKLPIYDAAGTLLGFIPIYDAIN